MTTQASIPTHAIPLGAPRLDAAVKATHALADRQPAVQTEKEPELISFNTPSPSTVTMSFAFDARNQSLNVVMTDASSGEVIRQFVYKSISPWVHQPAKLTGLLVNLNA